MHKKCDKSGNVTIEVFVCYRYQGQNGLGMPVGATVFCIAYAFVCAYGCGMIYATTGQQFNGGVCIMLQVHVCISHFYFGLHEKKNHVITQIITLTQKVEPNRY